MREDEFLHEGVFEIIEGLLLSFTPLPGGIFTYEVDKETCGFGEISDKTVVVVGKAKELADTFNIDRDILGLDHINLFLRHVDTLI